MDAKHTQGQWRVADGGCLIESAGGVAIATLRVIPEEDGGKETRDANAALLAAGPDLLAAAKWIRDNCPGLPAVARAIAEKAIAKAEGRP